MTYNPLAGKTHLLPPGGGVGDFADYCRETGKGHDITYEEALRILQKAEGNGFVHTEKPSPIAAVKTHIYKPATK